METPERWVSAFHYYEGFPARFCRMQRSEIAGAIGCLAPFLVASLVGLICAVYGFLEAPRTAAVTRLIGLLGLSSLYGFWFWEWVWYARHPSIVPYFQQKIGDIHTFTQGVSIAKHCQELDEMSLQLGVIPLSGFGFNDDFCGEELTWHLADKGLATVTRLIQALRVSDQRRFSDQDQVISELVAIEESLRKASERGIMFCLLLRTSGGTNAMEWEQRKGSCF